MVLVKEENGIPKSHPQAPEPFFTIAPRAGAKGLAFVSEEKVVHDAG